MKHHGCTILFVFIILLISGCHQDTVLTYQVQAVVYNLSGTGIFAVTVIDITGEEPETVTDATVTINDITVPYVEGMGYADPDGSLGLELTEGENVHLSVEKDELSVDENLAVPDTPVVTEPANGSYHDPAAPITANWNTLSPEPDQLTIRIEEDFTVSGEPYEAEVAADATTYVIPADTFKAESNVFITVDTLNVMNIEDDNLASTSVFVVGNEGYSGLFHTLLIK